MKTQMIFRYVFLLSLLLFLTGCPYIEEYSNSGCLENSFSYNEDYPGCGEDEVVATAEVNSINVTHLNSTYNCCPDDIEVALAHQGSYLRLQEKEILTTPCDCLCCYNVETRVSGLQAGEYTLEYCWRDYETLGESCKTVTVVVPN